MTNKQPPQWAINAVLGAIPIPTDVDVDLTALAALASLLSEERERCAKICDEERQRLEKFNTRDGIAMGVCAEQMAIKIRKES